MNISVETLTVLIYITPGLFASLFLDLILVRREKDIGSRITESLIFSLVIYGLVSLGIGDFPVSAINAPDRNGTIVNRSIAFGNDAILPTIAAALLLPLVVGHLLTARWLMRILRMLHVTGRTGRGSTWLDVFLDQKRYVIVNFSDGRRLMGWPQYYSDSPNERMLYLSDVAWYDDQGKPRESDLHGIFLVKNDSIGFIEFTHITSKASMAEHRRLSTHEST
jgi:hypothetical protein